MKRKLFYGLAAGILFFSSQQIFSYSLEDLKLAMNQNNPELLKLQQEYERAKLDVKDAKAGRGPTVDLQLSGTFMMNPPVDAIYLNVDDILNSIQWPGGAKPSSSSQRIKLYDGMENTLYNFQMTVTQPVFTWGKLENAVRLYRQVEEIKKTQLISMQRQMDMELETRIVSLYFLKEILTILEEEKIYVNRLVETSETAELSGMLLHQDVVDAKIQAKELEIAQNDLQEQINSQIIELQRTTGIKEISLETLECSFDENKIFEVMNYNREEAEHKALSENQLSIKMLNQLREVNAIAEKIAKSYVNWKPDVALQLTAGYGGSRVPLLEQNWLRKDDYTANLSVGIKTTIWDGGKKLNDVSRKISESKTADINKLDAELTIRKTLNSQWNTADVCSMKIEYQDLKLETVDSKIKQKETIFQSGYGSETEVLNVKIDRCNELIEKKKQELTRAVSCFTIDFLVN